MSLASVLALVVIITCWASMQSHLDSLHGWADTGWKIHGFIFFYFIFLIYVVGIFFTLIRAYLACWLEKYIVYIARAASLSINSIICHKKWGLGAAERSSKRHFNTHKNASKNRCSFMTPWQQANNNLTYCAQLYICLHRYYDFVQDRKLCRYDCSNSFKNFLIFFNFFLFAYRFFSNKNSLLSCLVLML